MSYILQALKKAEEERGASPRAVPTPRPLPPTTRPRWPWLAGGAVALAGVAGVLTLWTLELLPVSTSSGPPRTAAVPGAPPSPSAEAPPVAAVAPRSDLAPIASAVAPAAQPVRAEPPARLEAPASRVPPPPPRVEQPAAPRLEPAPPSERATAAGRAPATRAPTSDRPVAAGTTSVSPPPVQTVAPPLRSRSTTALTPSPSAQPERVAPPRASAPQPAVAAAPAPVVPPPPAAPAGDPKALAAKLSLQVLSWAPDPKDRFVFVNGRKYFEGQTIDDRFLIERIAEDSVVLSHQGQRVTLKGP